MTWSRRLLPSRLVPADELVAARQRPGRVGEQQTTQPPAVAIDDGVAQVQTERAAITQVMVPVQQFIPCRDLVRLRDHAQCQRRQPRQRLANHRPWRGAGGPYQRLLCPPLLRFVLCRQRENAQLLQAFEQALRGADAIASAWGVQVQVFADRMLKFVSTQLRKVSDGALHIGDLTAAQTAPKERRRLQFANGFVHQSLQKTVRLAYGLTGKGVCQALRRPMAKKKISHNKSMGYGEERKK